MTGSTHPSGPSGSIAASDQPPLASVAEAGRGAGPAAGSGEPGAPTHADRGIPPASAAAAALPAAVLEPVWPIERWLRWLPAVALVVVLLLLGSVWRQRGPTIVIRFVDGHGLRAGDPLKHHGIVVGQVRAVTLTADLDGVQVTVGLRADAAPLAVEGSRFWIVRPQVGLYGIQGLDTVVGNRYLAVLPGEGPARRSFVGLDDAPACERTWPGALEVVLSGRRRGSLRLGAPVSYRQVTVGMVSAVGLTPDAAAVEVRVAIEPAYRRLVRENTRFWNASGIEIDLGLLRGLAIDIESVQTMLAGGVALATPDQPGPPVEPGHRFVLYDRPESDWLAWNPPLLVGAADVPRTWSGRPVRLARQWRSTSWGGWVRRDHRISGWGTPVGGVVLVPIRLLGLAALGVGAGDASADGAGATRDGAPSAAAAPPVTLSLEGQTWRASPRPSPVWAAHGLARLVAAGAPVAIEAGSPATCRVATAPEDALLLVDARELVPLQRDRMTAVSGCWRLDSRIPLSAGWQGLPVLARADGRLIGVLGRPDDDSFAVLPLPELPPE